MAVSFIAEDYSRPIQPLFSHGAQVGIVHSVFKKATNITFNETLLALLSDELPRMPNSVRLRSVVTDELLPKMQPGMEVYVGNDALIIPTCDFSLFLSNAPVWEPRPDVSAYKWNNETVAKHTRLLTQFLAKKQLQDGLAPLVEVLFHKQSLQETPLLHMAMPKLRLLAQASWRQNIAGIEEATRGLAGLGPGLTPSGDDVLCGFAAIMKLLSPQLSSDSQSRKHIASIIATVAKPRTTNVSAVLLEHASRGEVAEQFGSLLLTLRLPAEECKTVLKAADRAQAFGASSGGDTLLGMLLGLRALEGEID
ncbi:MAG TPA: DUF2877 domain-containing protein [Ktedonobacteraceae bacterium]|nr:DUF2877 domain-containing protein [Ktedonobacteraceae bacterium]